MLIWQKLCEFKFNIDRSIQLIYRNINSIIKKYNKIISQLEKYKHISKYAKSDAYSKLLDFRKYNLNHPKRQKTRSKRSECKSAKRSGSVWLVGRLVRDHGRLNYLLEPSTCPNAGVRRKEFLARLHPDGGDDREQQSRRQQTRQPWQRRKQVPWVAVMEPERDSPATAISSSRCRQSTARQVRPSVWIEEPTTVQVPGWLKAETAMTAGRNSARNVGNAGRQSGPPKGIDQQSRRQR